MANTTLIHSMRLNCSQKDLAGALGVTSKAVDANSTLPVLNNVLMKAEGKKLYFTATNLEIAVTYWIDADVVNEGEVTVPSKMLTNYIGYLKDDKVELSTEEESILVNTSDSKTKIKGIASAEFPPIPVVEKEGGCKIKVKDFRTAIRQVSFSAAFNTTRPVLGGIFFNASKDVLKLVSTDSYRLSERTLPVQGLSGDISCIIPAKTIMELGSIVDGMKEDTEVEVTTSKNQVMFSVGAVQLISRLIEGQFPNYQQIIPKESTTRVEFDVSRLTLVLKRINIFARENNNKVIFRVSDKVLVTTEATQYGGGEVSVEAKIEGGPAEIALNSQFVLDLLGNISEGEAVFSLGEKVTPVLIRPKKAEGYLHVIMPLKI